ncbi:DUF1707 SHOCT-like domain-containing protein [Streptomyces sp. NPDC001056]
MTDDARPELRASDADRERVAEVLRDALAEGRLDMGEFEERLEATYRARTYGELAPITRDLPTGTAPASVSFTKEPVPDGSWSSRIVGGEGSSGGGVAILSGFERKGRWTMPKRFNCLALLGGADIDLRDADFADREVEINVVAVMGGVQVTVPPGVEVVVRGVGVMGAFEHPRDEGLSEPGAPRVVIGGFAFWGGVGVSRKAGRRSLKRAPQERGELLD